MKYLEEYPYLCCFILYLLDQCVLYQLYGALNKILKRHTENCCILEQSRRCYPEHFNCKLLKLRVNCYPPRHHNLHSPLPPLD